MARYRDFLTLVREARQHVLATGHHNLDRFDDDPQALRGYHCWECGQVWMILVYDIINSNIRQRNILECAEMPAGFDILLGILNADPEDRYLFEVSEPGPPKPIPNYLSRFDRDEPL